MRKILLAIPLLALVGACNSLPIANGEGVSAALCDRPLKERFARKVLLDARLTTVQTVALDCTGPAGVPDGLPDDLGRWVPPGE